MLVNSLLFFSSLQGEKISRVNVYLQVQMKISRFLYGVFFLVLHFSSSAWSKEGHHIICAISRQFLSDQARDSVQHYLNDMSLEEASVWMDQVRSQPGNAYMSSWHYLNLEKDQTYLQEKKPNVINRIQLAIYNLKNKIGDAATKQFNLKILIHLIGDLHQPLHVGYGSDRGGNDFKVQFLGKESNLHKLWDEDMIQSQRIDFEMCMKHKAKLSAFPYEKYNEKHIQDWAMESRNQLENVYKTGNGLLSSEYLKLNLPILELQLLKAGHRLAGLLNEIYGI